MVEVLVHRGPGGRVRPGGPGGPFGGAVVTVAVWRWDGYHRRVVTSGRLAAREPGRFRVADGTAGAGVAPAGARVAPAEIETGCLRSGRPPVVQAASAAAAAAAARPVASRTSVVKESLAPALR